MAQKAMSKTTRGHHFLEPCLGYQANVPQHGKNRARPTGTCLKHVFLNPGDPPLEGFYLKEKVPPTLRNTHWCNSPHFQKHPYGPYAPYGAGSAAERGKNKNKTKKMKNGGNKNKKQEAQLLGVVVQSDPHSPQQLVHRAPALPGGSPGT